MAKTLKRKDINFTDKSVLKELDGFCASTKQRLYEAFYDSANMTEAQLKAEIDKVKARGGKSTR